MRGLDEGIGMSSVELPAEEKLKIALDALKWIASEPRHPYSWQKGYSHAQLKAEETIEKIEPGWKANPIDAV